MNFHLLRVASAVSLLTLCAAGCAVYDSASEEVAESDAGSDAEVSLQDTGAVDAGDGTSVGIPVTNGVDILWMLDNSGSMCSVQASLRERFDRFIEELVDKDIQFQMGVTTTHMSAEVDADPVARPGHLQAIPQPVPSILEECRGDKGSPSDPMDGYKPVRENIQRAVACTKDPAAWEHLATVSDDAIDRALASHEAYKLFPRTPAGEQPGRDTPDADNPYRSIAGANKSVLSSEDYRDVATGKLDVERVKADFACMSLVGSTGDGFQKGLAASVHAVSAQISGGTVESPLEDGEQAPNHGLLRDDADFALMMVTTSNDCSDYGLFAGNNALPDSKPFLDENGNEITRAVAHETVCGNSVCAMWNSPDLAYTTPLISPDELAERLRENLAESKGEELDADALTVSSIHGAHRRYGADYPTDSAIQDAVDSVDPARRDTVRSNITQILQNPNDCDQSLYTQPYSVLAEESSCTLTDNAQPLGSARSGDRYERFLRAFDPASVVPAIPEDLGAHMPGLVCNPPDIDAAMTEISTAFAALDDRCTSELPDTCTTSEACPAFNYGHAPPTCASVGDGLKLCTSAVEVHLHPRNDGARSLADLHDHPYCIPQSVDSEVAPGGCVISRDMYTVVSCAGRDDAIRLAWSEPDYFSQLSAYQVSLVYPGSDTR